MMFRYFKKEGANKGWNAHIKIVLPTRPHLGFLHEDGTLKLETSTTSSPTEVGVYTSLLTTIRAPALVPLLKILKVYLAVVLLR